LISLPENFGFCGGYNRALQQVSADIYVLLNSDVEVTEGWMDPILSLFDQQPEIAAIQPKILSWHAREKFEYAGAGGGFIDSFGYPFCRGRLFNHVENDNGQYNDSREIFWASGACLFIRSKVYHEFGGLDEDFFAHMEEIDLCWKINRTDNKVFYCGESTVYHVGAGTLNYESPRKTLLNFRNGIALIYKHLDPLELSYKLPVRLMLDWVAAARFFLQGKMKNAFSVFQAHYQFFSHIGTITRKRRAIRGKFPQYSRKNIYNGLVLLDHFFGGRKQVKMD
jgi:GT2 family glycosyltransferase